MKFTDGYWQVKPGVTPHHPAHVHDVEVAPDALTVYAPTKRLTGRGDTLNLPLLTVRFSSPMANVIRVQLMHHKGQRPRPPAFELLEQPGAAVTITDDAEAATLTSGRLTVRVAKAGDWRIDFLDGDRAITGSGWKGMGMVDAPEGRFMHEQLNLGVGECAYGLGERFTAFVKNGQVVEMWNEDGGTSSQLAYKNVPFYLTNRGYGVFVNHPEQVSFEVASEKVERVQFSVPGEALDYFVIYGPSPKEVLARYTALTGRPALPPAWSFGLWLTTSFTTDYDEETVTGFIQGMADRDLPLHVFHFDCFWMKEFHWVNFEWDERVFPDPAGMLRRLKARGLRICVWINPYIAQRSALFAEGMANDFLVKLPSGDVWQWDRWQAGMGLVDFTNPAARAWYAGKLRELIAMGVDTFKTDFGERIPTDVVYCDGSDPLKMHNYYAYLYNQTVFELLEEELGEGQAAVFARSATAGGQRFPVHWGGDSTATFESMAESLRGGLSLGLCGFGFWSHDMGGFEQTASADVYKRWCAFGLLSSHSRLHGANSYRVPWLFDDEAVDVLRFFTQLKCRLMPYLFGAACQAHASGVPVMRAMALEFPDDPACDTLDRQYMLGDSLLVAPVFAADGAVDYYLPPGRWTHFLTGQVMEGGRWLRERHGYLSLPLLARPNSLIPVGADDRRPDYDFADGVTLHLFDLADGMRVEATVPALDGAAAMAAIASRNRDAIHVTTEGAAKPWRVLLRGVDGVRAVMGGDGRRGQPACAGHAGDSRGRRTDGSSVEVWITWMALHPLPRTNFAFLDRQDAQLVRLGMLAERYFPDDPNTCLLKLRQYGEVLAQLVAAHVGEYVSAEEAQFDLLRRLQDQGILPREVAQLLGEVRRAGNAASHELSGDHRTALSMLKISWQLGLWFHRTFADPAYRSGPFVPPVAPGNESEELRSELDRLAAQQAAAPLKAQPQVATYVAAATAAAELVQLDEAETRKLVDGQLRQAGWEADSVTQRYALGTRPEKGRNLAIAEWPTLRGPADYVLFVGLTPVAVVEAKRQNVDVSAALQQAKRYSRSFNVLGGAEAPGGPWENYRLPFALSTNGRPYLRQLQTRSGIWFSDLRRPGPATEKLISHRWT